MSLCVIVPGINNNSHLEELDHHKIIVYASRPNPNKIRVTYKTPGKTESSTSQKPLQFVPK